MSVIHYCIPQEVTISTERQEGVPVLLSGQFYRTQVQTWALRTVHPVNERAALTPLCRKRGTQRLPHLPEVTHLTSGRSRYQVQLLPAQYRHPR